MGQSEKESSVCERKEKGEGKEKPKHAGLTIGYLKIIFYSKMGSHWGVLGKG